MEIDRSLGNTSSHSCETSIVLSLTFSNHCIGSPSRCSLLKFQKTSCFTCIFKIIFSNIFAYADDSYLVLLYANFDPLKTTITCMMFAPTAFSCSRRYKLTMHSIILGTAHLAIRGSSQSGAGTQTSIVLVYYI